MKKIYKVTTQGDCEGRTVSTLGYASGDPEDIKKYFDDEKTYDIFLYEIQIIEITPQSTADKLKMVSRKKDLEDELQSLNRKLNKKW